MALLKPLRYSFMNEDALVDPRDKSLIGTIPKNPIDPLPPASSNLISNPGASGGTNLGNNIGSSSPILPKPAGTTDEYSEIYKRSQNALLTDPTPAKSKDEIYQERLRQSQGLIDSINQNFFANEQIASRDAAKLNQQTRQGLISQGLAGSSAAAPGIKKADDTNNAIMQSLQAQRANQIQAILTGIQSYADEEFTREQERFRAEAEGNIEMVDKIRKDKLASVNAAKENFLGLAKLGVDLNQLKALDPDQYDQVLKNSGFDDRGLAELTYNAILPKTQQIDYKFEKLADGQGLFYGTDPKTGELKQIKTSVEIPLNSELVFAKDGTPLVFDKTTGLARIADGFTQGQFGDGKDENSVANQFLMEAATQGLRVVDEFLGKFSQTLDGKVQVKDIPMGRMAAIQESLPVALQSQSYLNAIANLDTLKTNIQSGALTKMREASKTGGALGNVSDYEGKILQASLGSMDLKQEPEQFYKNMVAIQESLNRWSQALQQYGGQNSGRQNSLTPLNQSFSSINPLLNKYPYKEVQEFIRQFPDATEDEIKELTGDFKQAGKPQASTTVSGVGMRTDRHNNPTAFITEIAKQAGLKEGIDYVEGDPFPNNPSLKTAKLLGDPVKTTIQVIDKIGFFTPSGKQRWTHTAMSPTQWNKLSYEQKKNIVKQMYQKEGNKGALNNYFV